MLKGTGTKQQQCRQEVEFDNVQSENVLTEKILHKKFRFLNNFNHTCPNDKRSN